MFDEDLTEYSVSLLKRAYDSKEYIACLYLHNYYCKKNDNKNATKMLDVLIDKFCMNKYDFTPFIKNDGDNHYKDSICDTVLHYLARHGVLDDRIKLVIKNCAISYNSCDIYYRIILRTTDDTYDIIITKECYELSQQISDIATMIKMNKYLEVLVHCDEAYVNSLLVKDECCVCFETNYIAITHCNNFKHNVCLSCFVKVDTCPMCRRSYEKN